MEAATATAPRRLDRPGTRPLDRLRSDRRLVERFRAGDDAAFQALYERHRARVYAVCLGVLGSPDDAQDATQEAFASASRSLPAEVSDLRPWLCRVARNAAIDIARKRRPVVTTADVEMLAPGREDPEAALREIVAGLRELPERQRSALVMRELGGFTYAEIAAALDIEETAVTGLIARARSSLRTREESLSLACGSIRDRLAGERDGRRRPAEVRRHLRACDGCRDFQAAVRSERKVLRSLTPGGGLGLWQALAAWRGGRAALVAGALAKGSLGGGAAHLAAVCAVCVGTVGGVAELTGTLPEIDRDARTPAAAEEDRASASVDAAGTATPVSTSGAGARTSDPLVAVRRARRRAVRLEARARERLLRDGQRAIPPPVWLDGMPDELRLRIEAERQRGEEMARRQAEELQRRHAEQAPAAHQPPPPREQPTAGQPPSRQQPPPPTESPNREPRPRDPPATQPAPAPAPGEDAPGGQPQTQEQPSYEPPIQEVPEYSPPPVSPRRRSATVPGADDAPHRPAAHRGGPSWARARAPGAGA